MIEYWTIIIICAIEGIQNAKSKYTCVIAPLKIKLNEIKPKNIDKIEEFDWIN